MKQFYLLGISVGFCDVWRDKLQIAIRHLCHVECTCIKFGEFFLSPPNTINIILPSSLQPSPHKNQKQNESCQGDSQGKSNLFVQPFN